MSDFSDVLKRIETEINDVLFGDEKVKTEEGEYLSSKSDNLAMPEVHAIKKFKDKKAAVKESIENSELAAKEKQAVEKIKEKKEKIKKNIDYDMLAMPEVHWKKEKK